MRSRSAYLILLGIVLAASPAVARTPVLVMPSDVQHGSFYGSISGDYSSAPRSPLGYLETCVMTSSGDCSNDNTIVPFLVNDSHVDEFGGGATLGYGLAPLADGGKPRVEFGFNYLTGSETTSKSALLTGDNPFVTGSLNLLLIGIDGGSFQRCGRLIDTPPNCFDGFENDRHMALYTNDDYLDVDASIRTKQDEANFTLRYLIDYVAGSRTKITPFAGIVGGMLRTTFDAKGRWVDPSALSPDGADDTVLSSLTEKITTDYFGVEFGGQVTYELTDRLNLFTTLQATAMHQSAKFTGHDCLSREYGGGSPGPVPAACVYDPADPVDEAGFATSATDKIDNWQPAIALSLGLGYAITKNINLGLTGFASYDTSYRVVNPGGISSDDTLPIRAAHLADVHQWTPGAQATVTVNF